MRIILDEGPKYRYVADTWDIPKDLIKNTDYRYGLDLIDHFSKFYFCYLLENKRMDIWFSKIKLFMACNGLCEIFRTDNESEFDNK